MNMQPAQGFILHDSDIFTTVREYPKTTVPFMRFQVGYVQPVKQPGEFTTVDVFTIQGFGPNLQAALRMGLETRRNGAYERN